MLLLERNKTFLSSGYISVLFWSGISLRSTADNSVSGVPFLCIVHMISISYFVYQFDQIQ